MGFYLQLQQERICLFSEGGNRAVEKEVTENRVQISGYRYYSPRLGRWITRDPIGELDDHNLNSFVRNYPTGLIDNLGLEKVISILVGHNFIPPNPIGPIMKPGHIETIIQRAKNTFHQKTGYPCAGVIEKIYYAGYDYPTLGETEFREHVAKEEFQNADAKVFLFHGSHMFSENEGKHMGTGINLFSHYNEAGAPVSKPYWLPDLLEDVDEENGQIDVSCCFSHYLPRASGNISITPVGDAYSESIVGVGGAWIYNKTISLCCSELVDRLPGLILRQIFKP
jgi:RHS repeat-associated protein